MIQISFIQPPGEFFGIDRFDGVKELGRLARLVGLKMADQMELRVGQTSKCRVLFRKFLNVVFAEYAEPEGIRFAHHCRWKFLGNGYQRDRVPRSMRPADRHLDAILDVLDTFPQTHVAAPESHAGMNAAVAGGTP